MNLLTFLLGGFSGGARGRRGKILQVWFPGLGRSPGGGHDNPLQYSCLENSMDRGAWWVQSVAKSQTRLSNLVHMHARTHTHRHFLLRSMLWLPLTQVYTSPLFSVIPSDFPSFLQIYNTKLLFSDIKYSFTLNLSSVWDFISRVAMV